MSQPIYLPRPRGLSSSIQSLINSRSKVQLKLIIVYFLARRNTEEVLPIQLQTSTNELGNMTITEKASNNDLKKREKQTEKKRKVSEIDKWNAALGPYPVVSPGTKEASFVHAISSAGVAHAVTRSCSSGELENCGCDRSLRGMSPEGFQVTIKHILNILNRNKI